MVCRSVIAGPIPNAKERRSIAMRRNSTRMMTPTRTQIKRESHCPQKRMKMTPSPTALHDSKRTRPRNAR